MKTVSRQHRPVHKSPKAGARTILPSRFLSSPFHSTHFGDCREVGRDRIEMATLSYPGKEDVASILNYARPAVCERVRGATPLLNGKWENLLIQGDNLGILKTLAGNSQVAGKVSLVYIDPPFATNQEFRLGTNGRTSTISSSDNGEIAYKDTLAGAAFVEFLRKRIFFLSELLADDGSIYVHIDGKMGHYLKIVMDEVFGQENFRNDIARIKCNPKNFARKGFGNMKDVVLFYSKSADFAWNEPREEVSEADIERLFSKVTKDGRRYTTTPLHAPGETKSGPTGGLWKGLRPPAGRHWRYDPDTLTALDTAGMIEWSSTGNPRKIVFADQLRLRGKKLQDIWGFKDNPYPKYPTEKNLEMLDMIVRASSNKGGLVLDCFSGSGTTLVAAQNAGRRWIGIDSSPAAIRVAQHRLYTECSKPGFGVYKTILPRTIQLE